MLPPIPASLVPVTPQQDAVKPRPDIPPVTPADPSASESGVTLDRRHPQEAAERLAEEQRRRQRQSQRNGGAVRDGEPTEDTEPPAADDEPPRLGGHIDVSV